MPSLDFALRDLKLVYRVLHQHLLEHPDLMDSTFFQALQSHLHRQARGEGIDLTDHAQWDRWLEAEDAGGLAASP
jgi:hypothetical protein